MLDTCFRFLVNFYDHNRYTFVYVRENVRLFCFYFIISLFGFKAVPLSSTSLFVGGYHSADYISFPLESSDLLWNLWKWSSVHAYARGRRHRCKLYYCLWTVSITATPIFLYVVCYLFPKAIFWTFIHIWRMFWHCFISPSFGASGRLCFAIVVFPRYFD